jgi:glutaredoxin
MKNVTIYSTPTCHFCHMAKDFFKAKNIPFTDYNIADVLKIYSEFLNFYYAEQK